ncbi:MAG TPA: hypothetical protein VN701_00510 [Candidatus Paceibacterota bacterium]|nr:hypothetical protein [Candidatus Paceibacterota bacterium]
MPLVVVNRNPEVLTDNMAKELGPLLQRIVATALHVEGNKKGHLKPKDIEVRFQNIGPLDVNSSDLAIEIFANDVKGRRKDIQTRTVSIWGTLREYAIRRPGEYMPEHVVGHDNFVWILLAPAGFKKL